MSSAELRAILNLTTLQLTAMRTAMRDELKEDASGSRQDAGGATKTSERTTTGLYTELEPTRDGPMPPSIRGRVNTMVNTSKGEA